MEEAFKSGSIESLTLLIRELDWGSKLLKKPVKNAFPSFENPSSAVDTVMREQ